MPTINPYLNFNGNCLEAFEFYKAVFGGEFPYVGKYKEMPRPEGAPPLSEEQGEKITMPLEPTFWGDYFGMWTDKFGINWMVSFNENPKK